MLANIERSMVYLARDVAFVSQLNRGSHTCKKLPLHTENIKNQVNNQPITPLL
jgi:hypothetical protein